MIILNNFLQRQYRDLDSSSRQTANLNTYHVTKFSLYFSFTVHYIITNISSFTPVLSEKLFRTVFICSVSIFTNVSTLIWRLPFAVNVTLNLFNNKIKTHGLQEPWRGTMSLKITCEIRIAREGRGRRPAGSRNPSFLHP